MPTTPPADPRDPAPPPMQSPIEVSSTDDVRCLLWDLGGQGPSLLLVHATGFHHRVYAPLAARLPGFHCWAPDLRGHGDATSPRDHRYEWDGLTEDLERVMAHLPEPTRLAFGHSMGGAVLLRLEQKRPGTFDGLYLFEPIVLPSSLGRSERESHPMVEAARRRRPIFPSIDDAIANFASKPPFDVLDPECLRAYVEHGFRPRPEGGVELKLPGEEEGRIYAMSGAHDTFEHLGTVRCPVAVARGRVEAGTASAAADEIARRLPAGRLIAFDQLGHFGPLEDLDTISRSMARFFASLAGSDPAAVG